MADRPTDVVVNPKPLGPSSVSSETTKTSAGSAGALVREIR